jgi:hydroxyquinol 1,2-dioxygenase
VCNINEDIITQAVMMSMEKCKNPRLRTMMAGLIQHIHVFARDVYLTEDEWNTVVSFLTEIGHIADDKRQDFMLLSDTVGLSMLVMSRNDKKPANCTAASVFGPFFVNGAPVGTPGLCARSHPQTDTRGYFNFRSIRMDAYPLPHDDPVDRMLSAIDRHPWRPAHLYFMIQTPGYEMLITHVFREGDRYLAAGAAFGARSPLITESRHQEPGLAPDETQLKELWDARDDDCVLNQSEARA